MNKITYVVASTIVGVTSLTQASFAASTNVNQLVSPGLLVLSAPANASLSSAVTNSRNAVTTTGTLGTVRVEDERGSYAGWSLTASASDFTSVGQPTRTSGTGNLNAAGTYTGVQTGMYIVAVTTGGPSGTAKFTVSGLENSTPQTIVSNSNISVGSRGLVLYFGDANYTAGDSWRININKIPISGMTIDPGSLTTESGSADNVIPGVFHSFSSSTDTATLATAPPASGFGSYSLSPTISLNIPPLTPNGSYTATITETLN